MFPDAIIFDLDGTLLDCEFLCKSAIEQTVRDYNQDFPITLWYAIQGKPPHIWIPMILEELYLNANVSNMEFKLKWERYMHTALSDTLPMPGAIDILEYLQKQGIPIALATSSTTKAVELKRHFHPQLFSYISTIVCGDDIELKRGKPYPDIFILAATRLLGTNVKYENCIVIEDSVNGIVGGNAAGMKVIAVPDVRMHPIEQERYEKFAMADAIYSSLHDLLTNISEKNGIFVWN